MNMLEIEVKAFCDDMEHMRQEILNAGGSYVGILHEDDDYYNHPCRDFAETDEALRIRRSGDMAVVTYKGPKLSKKTKTRYEKEVSIDDPEGFRAIIEKLGFSRTGSVNKKREEYMIGEILVCLDTVESIGTFVELELRSEDSKEAEKDIFNLAEKLNLTNFTRKSYLEMVLEKKAG
ncbi:MAG: class IV adenylate cyclase [Spirochaetota bacterium]